MYFLANKRNSSPSKTLHTNNKPDKIAPIMGAVPKEKPSKGRTRRRRSQDKLEEKQTQVCPHCGEPKLTHRVCLSCGYYKGRKVV
ncbi:MAG: 50S ribosomal protein L32 [Patescibacteria group bacterium]